MKFRIEKSFDRDVDGIRDKKLLRKLQAFISTIENADTIQEIPHVKKIEGYKSYYRIKIGDHRLGVEVISNKEVVFLRFLHRKDIYPVRNNAPLLAPCEAQLLSGLAAGMQTIPFSANTGLKAPCESSRYKVEDFLTGFTDIFQRGDRDRS